MDVRIVELDMSLQKLSAIAFAANLWNHTSTKDDIILFFKERERKPEDITRENWINLVIKKVAETVDWLSFPVKLKEEIKNYVFELGGSILNFMEHTMKNGFKVYFGLRIQWTPHGTIDEPRMVREWIKMIHGEIPEFLPKRFLCLAGIYGEADLVKSYMNLIQGDHIIKHHLQKRFDGHDPEEVVPEKCPPKDFFISCFEESGNLFASRYFWNGLTCAEKVEVVCEVAQMILMRLGDGNKRPYVRQMETELLVFYIKKMSGIQRYEFVRKNSKDLFEAFLKTWPHAELALNIIVKFHRNFYCPKILKDYTRRVMDHLQASYCPDNMPNIIKYKNHNIYHLILEELLKRIPYEKKIKYFTKNLAVLFSNFHENFDYVTISKLSNNPALKELKNEMLSQGRPTFKKLMSADRFHDLDIYIHNVFFNKKDKKMFKLEHCNFVDEFTYASKFDLVIKNLNWLYNTDAEKNMLNPLNVLKLVEEKQFNVAENLFLWQYLKKKEKGWDLDGKKEKEDGKKEEEDGKEEEENGKEEKEDGKEEDSEISKSLTSDPFTFICNRLIKDKNFELLAAYLAWREMSVEQWEHWKAVGWVENLYLRDRFYKIWFLMNTFNNAVARDETCTEFLKLFLKTEKKVLEFRKDCLFDRGFFLKTFKNFVDFYDFYSCNKWLDLLKYCLRTPGEIKEIKGYLGQRVSECENQVWWD